MDANELQARFPRTSQYDPDWILEMGMGSHPLWMTEWLCQKMDLRPGMRVLDLGCGFAASSVFLAKEFGVQVWATDLWVPATDNWTRIQRLNLADQIIPIHADARSLPFAAEFFNAILAIDCFYYYGTDDLYLNYLVQFVKPGGQLGIGGAGLVQEMPTPVPEHLREFWSQDLWSLHSASWLRRHWERTGLVDIESADTMEDGWRLWIDWQRRKAPNNTPEITAIEGDAGRNITYTRLVARRLPNMTLADYAWPDTLKAVLKDFQPSQDGQHQPTKSESAEGAANSPPST